MISSDLSAGLRSGLVAAVSASPFGILFGAVAIDNGFSVAEAVLMSASVYAGASQLVGIELFGQHIAAWVVVLSVFAVNFRHILYSAALTPAIADFSFAQKMFAFFMLVDPQFAEANKRIDQRQPVTFRWYAAMALVLYTCWIVSTLIGGLFGKLIGDPHALGIDVLPAMYFLGLVMGFHRRANFYPVVIASAITSVAAFHLVGSPWHVSIGAAAGILVAAVMPLPAPLAAEQEA